VPVVVQLIAKVADVYKLDKRVERRFARHGAIPLGCTDSFLPWRFRPHLDFGRPLVPLALQAA
jgi:hypothetical protein